MTRIRTRIQKRIQRALHRARRPAPSRVVGRRCNFCRQDVEFRQLDSTFTGPLAEHGFPYPLSDFETLNYLEYQCPSCLSLDRDRLYVMYLRGYLATVGDGPVEVLEFAPSSLLRKFLTRKASVRYRCADLSRSDVDDQVDMTQMSCYPDGRFDFVICSHVLEHVDDDRKALAELRRILKPGGRAIVMVPLIDRDGIFDEDTSVTDEGERWRRFGQYDHVRLYSKEVFLQRTGEAGLEIAQLGSAHFGAEKLVLHGITEKSVLYVVTRPMHS